MKSYRKFNACHILALVFALVLANNTVSAYNWISLENPNRLAQSPLATDDDVKNGFSIGLIVGINYPLFGGFDYTYTDVSGNAVKFPATPLLGTTIGVSLKTSSSTSTAFQLDVLYSVARSKVNFRGSTGEITTRQQSLDFVPGLAVNITDNISVNLGTYFSLSIPFFLSADSVNKSTYGITIGARYLTDFGLTIGIRQNLDGNALLAGGQYYDVSETTKLFDDGTYKYKKKYRVHGFNFFVGYHFVQRNKVFSYEDEIPIAAQPATPNNTIAETEKVRAEAELAKAEAELAKAEAELAKAEAEKAKAELFTSGDSNKKIAENTNDPNQPQYRGGGDPLKGLNVAKTAQDLTIGNYYALLIGIDKYQGEWNQLSNAVNDAKAIEELLRSKYRFDKFSTLYDENATRSVIIKQMEWMVENVKEDDNVFIYYSGHGEYKDNLNKGYWVPYDANTKSTSEFISNNDIQTFLGGIKSKHTLLVSDACFSGDIFRGTTVSVPFEDSEKYYKKVHNLASRKAITSGGIEPVMDGGRDGHSVFAYYFIKSLRNNEDKYYDATQLYNSIKIPVVNNSEQSPKFQPIKNTGDEGGQFIFIRK